LEKIAEINMVAKVPAACKGAFYKGLKEYLTAAQQCYTTEERVYAAEQCDSRWKFLFRGLMDKAWINPPTSTDYSYRSLRKWCKKILQRCLLFHSK